VLGKAKTTNAKADLNFLQICNYLVHFQNQQYKQKDAIPLLLLHYVAHVSINLEYEKKSNVQLVLTFIWNPDICRHICKQIQELESKPHKSTTSTENIYNTKKSKFVKVRCIKLQPLLYFLFCQGSGPIFMKIWGKSEKTK